MTTEIILSYVAKKALNILENKFISNVVEKWSQYRARKFLQTFIAEIEKNTDFKDPTKLKNMIEEFFEDENKSEILFEAYRKVVLSASKNIGPIIIAIITAKLILEKKQSNETEDRIILAAENLSDNELISFLEFYYKKIKKENDDLEILLHEESYGESFENDLTAPPLSEWPGIWALKLKNMGILLERVTQKTRHYPASCYADKDYDAGISNDFKYYIIIPQEYQLLADYINTALKITNSKSS
ncbi:uncharacterized protein RVIR1_04730 [Candidatus Rickettsiella viridis]|uniref:Uncharacterized protein n=1 Tax=Candidatus Rickettsiella viridis TaxID=676208 RepID=A0A2Z5UU42_9COXI|nr:hypothetical protein [Candidatus Rickettsiella viridis]BBB14984.1 uncharacterized protein RVIR1_04730 [Candidatus Rickettsiella viridis]